MNPDSGHQAWLDSFLDRHNGVAGTVHIVVGNDLTMTASNNIPPRLRQIVGFVPHGKGMAGAAQTARRTVQTCNLQAPDPSDPVNPAAREAGGKAAAAIPVIDDGRVLAVVGITFEYDGEIDEVYVNKLERDADGLRGVGT